ncbi:MAG: ArsR family transcriptional regulator [Deltaproteobacteria bacterium]|nr:ArsR family transcriptional regulator [Deltaproteobacteria bacterium]
METKTATAIFEALTSGARLAVFRLLVKYAPDGLVAGDIARMLGMPKTNLSFHLKAIVHSGLAGMERQGRHTRYRANIPLMREIIAYLTAECCTGRQEQGRNPQAPGCPTPESGRICKAQTVSGRRFL